MRQVRLMKMMRRISVESPNPNSDVPAKQVHGSDGASKIAAPVAFIFFRFMGAVRAAFRDMRCMKSACRAKQPTLTTGCHCSKLTISSRTTWTGTKPRRYAVLYSDFTIFIQIYGAHRNDDPVLLLAFPHSCFVAALSIFGDRSTKFEFEI
jgi:hypothetical protein